MVEIKQILAWIILKKYSEGESKDSYTQKQRMKTSVATEYSTTQLNEPITLTPPADVEEWLKEKIVESYLGEHMPPGSLEILYQNEITVYNYISTDYYKNEIETHKAESESFPNVSNYYENERTYLEWYYNEMLNISNQQSKK